MLSLLALGLPGALVRVPPLLDYPNHLARLWLLAGGGAGGPLASIYGFDWTGAITNVGFDRLAAALGPLTGPDILPPVFLMLACVLPPAGAVLLNRTMFGGWHWWQCGFGLLAWSFTLLAGFLNFQLSLGLALLGAAADPAFAGWRLGLFFRVAPFLRLALGSLILICHPFGCLFYGVLIAALGFGPERGISWARLGRGFVAGGTACLIPLALFWTWSPVWPGSHADGSMYLRWGGDALASKLLVAASLVVTYDPLTDLTFLFALWFVLRILIGIGRGRTHAGLLYAALTLAFLALVTPAALANTAYVDIRLPLMAALLAASALRPAARLPAATSAALLTALVLARTAWIDGVWDARQSDMRSLARALATVPAGARIVPTEHCCALGPIGRRLLVTTPTDLHDPALAIPWRQAFVPTLFAAPGKQPLRVLPPYKALAVLEGATAPVRLLREYISSPTNHFFFGYLEHWREQFDYVLVVNADTADDGPDEANIPELQLVSDEGFARLYRITGLAHAAPGQVITPR